MWFLEPRTYFEAWNTDSEDGDIEFLKNIVTRLLNFSGFKTQKAVMNTSYITL
jgi:hypothetical protein